MELQDEFYFRYNYLNHPDKSIRKKYKKGEINPNEDTIYKATRFNDTRFTLFWFNSSHSNCKLKQQDIVAWLNIGYLQIVDEKEYLSKGNRYLHQLRKVYGDVM